MNIFKGSGKSEKNLKIQPSDVADADCAEIRTSGMNIFKGSGKSEKNLKMQQSYIADADSAEISTGGKGQVDSTAFDAVDYKDGDYQLRVHIIECADLVAPGGAGFVSPVVFVQAASEKAHTKQKRNVSGCIFNETFHIHLKDMNESKIQDCNVTFKVVDSSHPITGLLSNRMIGSFSVDLETVYQSPGHEIYRQWVPLLSPVGSELSGKLLLSVSALGPADRPVVHDRKAEIASEKLARAGSGKSTQSMTLFAVPTLTQKLRFLVLEVFKAEGIPVLDIATAGESLYSYISASIAVEFDKHDKVHTGTAHLVRGQINDAEYMTALWLPFMDPCFSGRIQLRLLEHHTARHPEVQSSSLCPSLQLRNVKLGMDGKPLAPGALDPTQLFWANMYGAPVPESFKDRQSHKLAKNTYPEGASAYRGRLLLRVRISDVGPPASGRNSKAEVFRCAITREYINASLETAAAQTTTSALLTALNIGGLTRTNSTSSSTASVPTSPVPSKGGDRASSKATVAVTGAPPLPVLRSSGAAVDGTQDARHGMSALSSSTKSRPMGVLPLPKTRRYVLKALVFAGHAFPQRSMLSSSRYSVELRLMHRRLLTPEIRMDSGYAAWDVPVLLRETFELPEDTAMLPDLFLYVLNKSEELAPLSYKRFPLSSFLSRSKDQQFQTPADWEILQLDTCYSFPSPDTFPGAVLIKLGFGPEEVADKYPWCSQVKTKCSPYQVNIHVYQGRGLPPSDSTGLLDPYVLVRVGSGSGVVKTAVHKQTRDPQFYETLSFHMDLPDEDDLKPQLFLELYDQDLAADDFVGLLKLDLALAHKREVRGLSRQQLLGAQLRAPEWHGLRSRTGGDLMGQLLVDFEILVLDKSGVALLPSPALEPETRPWVLDMKVLGLRDLEPVTLLPPSKPYAHITLQHTAIRKLPPSRKPTATDPNFLACFEELVQLPTDVRFAPSLAVTVKDRRVAGLPATVLGAVSIPLEGKMTTSLLEPDVTGAGGRVPDSASQFRPGNPFLPKEDLVAAQILLHDSSGHTTEGDRVRLTDFGLQPDLARRKAREDLQTLLLTTRTAPPGDDLPEYLHGRLCLAIELESVLDEAPFERYPITTGSVAAGLENALDTNFTQVGVLKCTVALRPHEARREVTRLDMGITEENVKIRLYVLRGHNLVGVDSDNNSDPYLVVRYGKQTHSTRERHKRNTKEPRFYECFEFTGKLPGVNDILISVKDHNDVYSDELIGATVIDLEDRWFCKQWRDLCRLSGLPGAEPMAPLEVRSLWNPASNAPQGSLSMWLDILTVEEARHHPIKNVSPPAQEDWEVRVIVWSATDVPISDTFEGMNDLYIKCKLGTKASAEQSTDTHLRLPAGQKGSFNWRMKFPLKLPVPEDCEGGTRLTVEAWDLDFITSSQGMGSCQIDLSDAFDTAMRKRKRKLQSGSSARFVHQVFYKPLPPTPSTGAGRRDRPAPTSTLGSCWAALVSCWSSLYCCCCGTRQRAAPSNARGRVSLVTPSVRGGDPIMDSSAAPLNNEDLESGRALSEGTPLLSQTQRTGPSYSSEDHGAMDEATELDEQPDLPDIAPTRAAESAAIAPVATPKRRRRRKRPTMYDSAMQAMGLAPAVIEHAAEVQLSDARGNPAGKVLMSIEILHKSVADTLPAGTGRSEPNSNPALPEPEGRIDFTKMWNPFYMLRVCAGEKIFTEFACIFSCLLCLVVYYFVGQPFLTLFMAFKDIVGTRLVLLLMVALVISGAVFCLHVRARCRKVCCSSEDHDDEESHGDGAV